MGSPHSLPQLQNLAPGQYHKRVAEMTGDGYRLYTLVPSPRPGPDGNHLWVMGEGQPENVADLRGAMAAMIPYENHYYPHGSLLADNLLKPLGEVEAIRHAGDAPGADAINHNPWDATAHEVFADWLDENGHRHEARAYRDTADTIRQNPHLVPKQTAPEPDHNAPVKQKNYADAPPAATEYTESEMVAAYARLKAEGDEAGMKRLRRLMAGAGKAEGGPEPKAFSDADLARPRPPSRNLTAMFRQARQDPYEETGHGVIADALDEEHPGNHIGHLIREQFGLGEHDGNPRHNLNYEPVENSWAGTFPYAARLGAHGPFDLYLRHESPPYQPASLAPGRVNPASPNARWVVHAVARVNRRPELNDFGYTFEFPHEEAHRIPQMFPAAKAHINSTPKMGETFRSSEAQAFEDRMDEEERSRA